MSKSLRTPQQRRLQKLMIEARKGKRLTQAELAARLKRPQSFVAKYEGGERRLDVIEFIAVAEALDVDPQDILADLTRAERRGR